MYKKYKKPPLETKFIFLLGIGQCECQNIPKFKLITDMKKCFRKNAPKKNNLLKLFFRKKFSPPKKTVFGLIFFWCTFSAIFFQIWNQHIIHFDTENTYFKNKILSWRDFCTYLKRKYKICNIRILLSVHKFTWTNWILEKKDQNHYSPLVLMVAMIIFI